MPIQNQVQLITYPDSLGGNLSALNQLLEKQFAGLFPGGVHILPPFPSSGDRGFAPKTYFEIDPAFGSWQDIRHISAHCPVLLDLMVNHISRQSEYFQDFRKHGRHSRYADLFITLDKIWPRGVPLPGQVAKIFLRRPEHPFTDIRIEDTGEIERVWATFGSKEHPEQIDLDVNSAGTRRMFIDILHLMGRQGVKMLRLDAVAYVTKQPGTDCFFVEPQIYEFLHWMEREAGRVGIQLLPEVHAHYDLQFKLSEHGFWVYDFTLPLLILHTLLNRSSRALLEHLQACPRRQFTQLDSHDGVPVQPDVDGILEIDEAQKVVAYCLSKGGNISPILSDEHKLRPDFDAHQINCTYFSALDNEDAYVAARAIQFFSPGIPQVYYVGLLAGENDSQAVRQTGEGRAINRHNFSLEEIQTAIKKPVVQRLFNLIRFRNTFPAFDGEFRIAEAENGSVGLSWEKGAAACRLEVDLSSSTAVIHFREQGESGWQTYKP